MALSLDIHKGVRRLKAAGTIADPIGDTGTSIMAGCTNSTSFSRAYIKKITKGLKQDNDLGHLLFEHVDDLAQLFFCKTEAKVRSLAFDNICELARLVKESLLTLSSKSVVVDTCGERPAHHVEKVEKFLGYIHKGFKRDSIGIHPTKNCIKQITLIEMGF